MWNVEVPIYILQEQLSLLLTGVLALIVDVTQNELLNIHTNFEYGWLPLVPFGKD